jgi:hypothetical protein
MIPNNSLATSFPRRRESSKTTFREANKIGMLSRIAGHISINWIPACAGMTGGNLMDNLE